MKKIKIEFTNERIIPASGLAVVGAILGKSDFVKQCNRMDVTEHARQFIIGLSRSNTWRWSFAEIYRSFADFWQ